MLSYVVVSDLQYPYIHRKAVDNLLEFIDDYNFDGLLNVGDDIDSPEPSRWNKGTAGEYAPTLHKSVLGVHDLHRQFVDALGKGDIDPEWNGEGKIRFLPKPYHVMRSNHGDRVETYVSRYAPALASLPCLKIDELIGYEKLGITYHRQPYEFAPGWVLMHGDEGGTSISAGGTALGLAKAAGRSVVCGHTHKLGAQHWTQGVNGKTRTTWGVEAGHLMDIRQASYLGTGSSNWSMGFAIIHIEGSKVSHSLVPIEPNGSFIYDGARYA